MGLGGCCKFLKFIVFLINILIALVGVAVLVLGTLALINGNGQKNDGANLYFVLCVMVIVMGSLLTVVGLIGCCGAALENQCLLGTFVFIMTVALALDVVAAVLVEKNGPKIIEKSEETVKLVFSNLADKDVATNADLYQQTFGCCGGESHADWEKARLRIPPSCCKDPANGCDAITTALSLTTKNYKEGCRKITSDIMKLIINKSPLVFAIVGIFEALALITSLGLCCSIRKMGYY